MGRKKLVVFEDSSQCHFGGGQKVSLDVIEIAQELYDEIIVFDYANSAFASKLMERKFSKVRFCKLRKMKGMGFLFSYVFNAYIALVTVVGHKVDFYAATKIGVLFLPVLRPFVRKAIYHGHNVERNRALLFKGYLLLFMLFDRVICVSHCVRNSYPEVLRRRVPFNVLYNAIKETPSCAESSLDSGGRLRVAYVGSLIPIKSVDTLVAAFVDTDFLRNADLDIYGDGPERENLEKMANSDERIRFLGFSSSILDDLGGYDLLVLPTRIEEACPLVLIESMFRRVPVLVSNHGGQMELLEIYGFGLAFEVGSVYDCAQKISRFLEKDFVASLADGVDQSSCLREFEYANFKSRMLEWFHA